MKDNFSFSKPIYFLGILILSSCDLGNFDPVDIFSQEPLDVDAVALETTSGCDFTLLVNNDRIQQAGTTAAVKGSLYAAISESETYLGSGEFSMSTDTEGRVTALNGFANTQFYQTSYLDASVSQEAFFANIALNTGALPDVFENNVLPTDGCYLYYEASEDTAIVNSGNGILQMKEMYVNPISEFMLYRGGLELSAINLDRQWLAIDPKAGFDFEADNSLDEFVFNQFTGQIYTETTTPITTDSILINSTGRIIIDGNINNGGLRNFFNASSSNMQLGTNGEAEISYVLEDRLLDDFDFYASSDKSARDASFTLSPSTFHFKRNNGLEEFSFYGETSKIQDIATSFLTGHSALRVLEYPDVEAILIGNFKQPASSHSLKIQHNPLLNLGENGSYELRDAELAFTPNSISLDGIFVSPFATLPDIFIGGNLNADGNMELTGQSLFVVNFDDTTLPVTFSVAIEVDGESEILTISGLAEFCDQGSCSLLPLDVSIDFDTEILQLCLDIPNQGTVCIQ